MKRSVFIARPDGGHGDGRGAGCEWHPITERRDCLRQRKREHSGRHVELHCAVDANRDVCGACLHRRRFERRAAPRRPEACASNLDSRRAPAASLPLTLPAGLREAPQGL